MTTRFVLAALLFVHAHVAHADPILVSRRADGIELARTVVVDDETSPAPSTPEPRVIFLNRRGATLMPGADDSRVNRSSLVSTAVTIPPWQASDALWTKTVSCLRAMYARFDVAITDVDPGSAPHVEAVFGGSPALLGLGDRIAGVAPFSTRCRTIDNAIVLTFTDALPGDARTACEVMAQEIGHSYGLDHELLAEDPMTYLPYDAPRSFQDQLASCGEWEPRPCGAPGYAACSEQQSSVAMLIDHIGLAGEGDRSPPEVSITSPSGGALVRAGFEVTAEIRDDRAVKVATLSIDGVVVDTLSAPPWVFATPMDMRSGSYRVTVNATDGANEQLATVEVDVAASNGSGGETAPLVGCTVTGGDPSDLAVVMLAFACVCGARRLRFSVVVRHARLARA